MMVTVDPLKAYTDAPKDRLIAACGILPQFFAEAVMQGNDTAESVYKAMVAIYGFGDYSGTSWGTVSDEGVYKSSYDEDPDMSPLLLCEWPDSEVKMYCYEHAILAVVDDEKQIITRMD